MYAYVHPIELFQVLQHRAARIYVGKVAVYYSPSKSSKVASAVYPVSMTKIELCVRLYNNARPPGRPRPANNRTLAAKIASERA